jgi:hypothetical protein
MTYSAGNNFCLLLSLWQIIFADDSAMAKNLKKSQPTAKQAECACEAFLLMTQHAGNNFADGSAHWKKFLPMTQLAANKF